MKPLIGLNKKYFLIILSCLLLFSAYKVSSGAHKETNIGNEYYITVVTPTIQTISQKNGKINGYSIKGKHSLIRGKIEFLSVNDLVISGYLSTRFFKEDELIGLGGRNDKEGFFIIDKNGGSVQAGLTGEAFFFQMEQKFNQKEFDFLRPEEY